MEGSGGDVEMGAVNRDGDGSEMSDLIPNADPPPPPSNPSPEAERPLSVEPRVFPEPDGGKKDRKARRGKGNSAK